MLPGFSNNEMFMAIEGFTSNNHNRSDEAFTVADLDKFRKENNFAGDQHFSTEDIPMSRNGSSEKFVDDEISPELAGSNNTKLSLMDAEDDMEETTSDTTTSDNKSSNTGTTKSTTTTTTKSRTTRPTTTKATSSRTTTTKMSSSNNTKTTTTRPKTTSATMEEEEETETTKTTKSPTTTVMATRSSNNSGKLSSVNKKNEAFAELDVNEEEEDRLNPEEDDAPEEETVDGMNEAVEGFTGSMVVSESGLRKFLIALLLAFIVFVLVQPKTGKLLGNMSSQLFKFREVVLALIALVVFYIILLVV
jgi:hypothetical protein